MERKEHNGRVVFLGILLVLVFGSFAIRLMKYQVVDAEEYKQLAKGGYTSVQTIQAARGEIMDRYGRPLATNRLSFDVMINEAYMPNSSINIVIQRIITLMEAEEETWIDNLPISKTIPFAFLEEESSKQKIEKLKTEKGINMDASAAVTLQNLFKKYKLDTHADPVMARKVAGVRYEMELAGSSNFAPYTFSRDVPRDTVVKIREYSQELQGVEIRETTTRQYTQGSLAPHVVGIVGAISKEEYDARNAAILADVQAKYPQMLPEQQKERYNEQRYGYTDIIGKSGLEYAMEEQMRGENGKKEIRTDSKGNVLESTILKEARPGNTLVLTLDNDLQRATIAACKKFLEETTKQYKPEEGGNANKISTVAIDVQTGEILAMVNYPGYDLSDYYTDYQKLSTDPLRPLYNSATQGLYMPGSIFKPVVAAAGFANGLVNPSRRINCVHRFTAYEDYQPTCMGTHGAITVRDALKVSCNYFFYQVGAELGIDPIVEYAKQFGLGVKTGIEIGEEAGHPSSKEFFENIWKKDGILWTPGNVLQAAIGQLDNAFTPLQMAVFTATLANNGTRMRPHLVKSVESYNLNETVSQTPPEVMQIVETGAEAFSEMRAGMLAASRDLASGTARAYFGNYPIDVASKTGTPQATGGQDNATFIAYAPANNPEIAVSVVVEKGYSGQRGAPVARAIFDQYFGLATTTEEKPIPGQLLP